ETIKGHETDMTTDPFSTPAAIPSTYPKPRDLKGRLLLITPVKLERVPNTQGAPGDMQDRITADVKVVDGSVPGFDDTEFTGVYFSGSRVVPALAPSIQARGTVLARFDTRFADKPAGKGNPWGLQDPTEADKQTARDYLAGKTVDAAQAPAQAVQNPFA